MSAGDAPRTVLYQSTSSSNREVLSTKCARRCGDIACCPASASPLCATTSPAIRSLRSWKRSEEHTSELQSLMRISYAVFCLKKKNKTQTKHHILQSITHKQMTHKHTEQLV